MKYYGFITKANEDSSYALIMISYGFITTLDSNVRPSFAPNGVRDSIQY